MLYLRKPQSDIFKAFTKKLRGSLGLHLWTDHSSIIQVGDMQETCPLIDLAEDHCPLTFIREIKSSLPTQVSGKLTQIGRLASMYKPLESTIKVHLEVSFKKIFILSFRNLN